jgi:NAD(P)-dependent dehydrogenase (short-subunit alcohol dehydrogenase family)
MSSQCRVCRHQDTSVLTCFDGAVTELYDGRGRVALVTGANKGIGFATAAGLGRLGITALLGARDEARGVAAVSRLRGDGLDARFLHLDVTDEASVQLAVRSVEEDLGRLDILVNNAAIKLEVTPSPPSECTLAMVSETFETNVFGSIRVLLAMLPLLRRSDAPRIVNVSSGLGSLTLATTEGTKYIERPLLSYNPSKAALNSVTVQFANELRGTPFKVNAADPGYTNTDMTGSGERGADEGAAIVIRLATLPDDGPTGMFFDERGELPW